MIYSYNEVVETETFPPLVVEGFAMLRLPRATNG